ncbi:MAG: 2-phospho-L-lactate guanylyltransferase [Pseudomonadales bacterium]|jgi:2-phospho-L-lactate guanylyltransferase|nr:2-phospho-L-lactate guanylyltransferase [Pseudomonadales bacterium]MBP9032243.1 2-phospho-L-lactate guanylyltransferase [Pseudomonadales bacterium]
MIPPALWVLVPLKNLGRAKERLSGALVALQRRELVEAMARDVIEALQAVPVAPARIVLVSDDADVAALAAEYGVALFRPAPAAADPLNAALTEALGHVRAQGAEHVLVMHADLPLARAAELRALIEAHLAALGARGAPLATLVTDRAREGSNCLLSTPPDALPYRFGAGSRARHHEAARAAGVRWAEHDGAGLGQDIDHPDDLAELVAICQSAENAGGAHTTRLLRRRGDEGIGHTF